MMIKWDKCRIYIILSLLFIFSCNEKEDVPSFMSINSIGLTSNYATQGTSRHNIRDAWVYIDGNVLGVYEMPARFPVLAEGMHSISIAPGILVNGISATRLKYPFYTFFDTIVNFIPGQTIEIPSSITVKYSEGQEYTWYEDFENAPVYTFQQSPNSQASYKPENTINVFEGNHSAEIIITTDNPVFYGYIDSDKEIISQNKTFLEMNYKAEQSLSVGMIVTTGANVKTVYALTVNKSDAWNKIYIDLSKIVNENQAADNFRVYILSELESGRSQSIIYLDNLKLIHN